MKLDYEPDAPADLHLCQCHMKDSAQFNSLARFAYALQSSTWSTELASYVPMVLRRSLHTILTQL